MIEQGETKSFLQADGYTQQGVSSVKSHVDPGKTTRATNTPLLKTNTNGTGGLKIAAPDNMYGSSRYKNTTEDNSMGLKTPSKATQQL